MTPSNDYAKACRLATHDQGLDAFAAADGWTVEQTGGFTMVAVLRTDPRGDPMTTTRATARDGRLHVDLAPGEALCVYIDGHPVTISHRVYPEQGHAHALALAGDADVRLTGVEPGVYVVTGEGTR